MRAPGIGALLPLSSKILPGIEKFDSAVEHRAKAVKALFVHKMDFCLLGGLG